MNEGSTTVLTISRQLGSGGAFIGQDVARRLGMRYVDREILQRAATESGLAEGDLEAADERAAGFWHAVSHLLTSGAAEAPYAAPAISATYEEGVFQLEQRIIREIAERFDSVIVGRAGYHLLAEHAGAIHIMVHARMEWRVARVMEVLHVTDLRTAREMVERSDRQRARFIRAVTGRHWTDARAFDLCIDTSTTGLDTATDLVVALVSSRKARTSSAGNRPTG
jgi:cytidylate kinase